MNLPASKLVTTTYRQHGLPVVTGYAATCLLAELGRARIERDGRRETLARNPALRQLTAQAHTLDAIFHKLARKATHVEYLNQLDVNLRLALKAQSQCRATVETLAAIKNPQPVAFVRQANIAHGPQQVNNESVESNTRERAQARAKKSKNQPNKVLEHQHGERLDFGTAGAASGADSTLETVGAIHRPKDG